MTTLPTPTDDQVAVAAAAAAAHTARRNDLVDPAVFVRIRSLPSSWVSDALARAHLPGEQGPDRGPAARRLHATVARRTGRPAAPNLSHEQVAYLSELIRLLTPAS